jgi:cytochrome P450
MNSVLLAERPAHVSEDRVVDFDMFAPPGGKADIHAGWKTLHAPGIPEIVWTPRNGGHWIATRAKQIAEIYADYERFSSRVYLLPKESGEKFGMIPLSLSPPEHRPFRALLNAGFSPKAVNGITNIIRKIAADLIEGIRLRGYCNFTTDYAEAFPLKIFMLMVNLPFSDAPTLKKLVDELLRPTGELSPGESAGRLAEYMAGYVDARIGAQGDDLLTHIVNGEIDGRSITRDEALSTSLAVLAAGLDTVANFASFALLFLARNPDRRRELIADPELIPRAVDELLRRYPVAMGARELRSDIEYCGVQMKKGEMILAPGPLAGLDEQWNANPLEVDFHRRPINHATFGGGVHQCAGHFLARTEMRITLEEWLSRIPEFEVAPGAEITFTGGHVVTIDRLPLVWDPATTVAVDAVPAVTE